MNTFSCRCLSGGILLALSAFAWSAHAQSTAAPIHRGAPIKSLQTAAPATNAATPAVVVASIAPSAVTNAPAKAVAPVTDKDGDYLVVGFDRLSGYSYEVPDESKGPTKGAPAKDQIPAPVRALNSQKVVIKGFMLPLKVEGGLITELLIMRDQSMCCYGAVPKINEWVSVRMTGKGVKPIMDQTVSIYGTLKVGEIRENGYLVGIYEMSGERMAAPLDL